MRFHAYVQVPYITATSDERQVDDSRACRHARNCRVHFRLALRAHALAAWGPCGRTLVVRGRCMFAIVPCVPSRCLQVDPQLGGQKAADAAAAVSISPFPPANYARTGLQLGHYDSVRPASDASGSSTVRY